MGYCCNTTKLHQYDGDFVELRNIIEKEVGFNN